MHEGSQQTSSLGGTEMPRAPNAAHSGIGGEDGVRAGQLVERGNNVAWVDRSARATRFHVRTELALVGRVLLDHGIEELVVGLRLYERQQGLDRLADITAQAKVKLRSDRKSKRLNSRHLVISYAV